jgi:hypothetical protein
MSARGGGGPPESPRLFLAEVSALWVTFRSGDVATCPRDRFGVALSVDGATKSYRLVCTQCGLASPWFGTTPTGIVFRTLAGTIPGSPPDG